MTNEEHYFQWCDRYGIDRETAKAALWQLRLLNNNSTYWDAFRLARCMSDVARNTATPKERASSSGPMRTAQK